MAKRKLRMLIGFVLFLTGILLIISTQSSITGNTISEGTKSVNSPIFSLILIIVGLVLMATGNLEQELEEYDGVIILGRNWRGYPFKSKVVNGKLDLNVLSKVNCLVAADMYEKGQTRKIIIGGGKTAGKKWPSEAKAMKEYISKKYPEIPKKDILIQEKTLDTYDELDEDMKLAKENDLEKLALITIDSQLPRCKKVLGDSVDYISSEEEIKKRSPHYKRLIKDYRKSPTSKYESFKESVLRVLQKLGLEGNFTKPLAKIIRRER